METWELCTFSKLFAIVLCFFFTNLSEFSLVFFFFFFLNKERIYITNIVQHFGSGNVKRKRQEQKPIFFFNYYFRIVIYYFPAVISAWMPCFVRYIYNFEIVIFCVKSQITNVIIIICPLLTVECISLRLAFYKIEINLNEKSLSFIHQFYFIRKKKNQNIEILDSICVYFNNFFFFNDFDLYMFILDII